MGEQVVVTGATGLVGRALCRLLQQRGVPFVVAVRDLHDAPVGAADAVQWSLGQGLEGSVLAGARALIHLAAYVPADLDDPGAASACLEANGVGTLRLLQDAGEAGVGAVLHVGAGNAYLPTGGGAIDEDRPLYPRGRAPYYLTSKVVEEVFAAHWAGRAGFRHVVLRASAICGPGPRGKGFVPLFARRLAAGEPVELADGGRYRADLVFVDDVAGALIEALERDVAGAFNLGSGTTTSVREVAEALVSLLGADPDLLQLGPEGDGPTPGYPPLDITRARAELGYVPTPLVDMLRAFVP